MRPAARALSLADAEPDGSTLLIGFTDVDACHREPLFGASECVSHCVELSVSIPTTRTCTFGEVRLSCRKRISLSFWVSTIM